jgi:hypothetical protein
MELREPGMAINTRTLVVPSFIERRIHPQVNDVATAIDSVIRYVEAEGCVAAKIPPQTEAVEEGDCIAKDPVEVERDAQPFVVCRNFERSPVTTDTRCRELSS